MRQNQNPATPAIPRPSSFEDHPLAELFPLMEPDDLSALADNIREHGLRTPIVLFEGRILDGRNRARACQLAGVEPRTEDFPADGDPLAFVLSSNLHRRHLTTSQRALLAARIATLPQGQSNKKKEPNSALSFSLAAAAEKLSVGKSIIKDARTVLQDPAQTSAVESGQKSIHAAASEIRAAQAARSAPRDHTNFAVPEPLWPLWQRRAEVDNVVTHLSNARQAIQSACDQNDPLFAPTDLPSVLRYLDAVSEAVSLSALYAVCDVCHGLNSANCKICRGRGFLTKEDLELAATV